MGRQVELVRPSMETERISWDMSPINTNSKRLGMLITLYKGKAKAASAAAGGNAARYTFSDLIGVSEPFVQLKRFAEEIAATPSPILIQGESGTGKELFANAIHCASQRRDKPFVAINCSGNTPRPHRQRAFRLRGRLLHRGQPHRRQRKIRAGGRRHALPG